LQVAGGSLSALEQPVVTVEPLITTSPMGARLTFAVTFQRHQRDAAAFLVARLRGAPSAVFDMPASIVWLRTADAVSAMEMSAQVRPSARHPTETTTPRS
jgi:hypothetical protein